MVYGADGLIYTSASLNGSVNETLIAVNPITGTYTVLGELPAGFYFQGDLFLSRPIVWFVVRHQWPFGDDANPHW